MLTNYERVIHVAARAHVPLAVLFEVTHRCNPGCEHCYLTGGRWAGRGRRARS